MEIVTSWMEQGIEQGIKQGQAEGFQQVVLSYTLRLLKHKFREIDSEIEAQVRELSAAQLQDLGEALLDCSTIADVVSWLEGTGEQGAPFLDSD